MLILIHVRRDCRRLDESWPKFILPVIFFWWIFYPLWLFLWPGTLRLKLQGKQLTDTPLGWAIERKKANRESKAPS